MSPSDDVAMDDPASLPCDVSSGSTPGFGVDVVDQQQLRAAALQWHQCSQPVASHPGAVVSPHHNPRVLLGCVLVRGRVVVQWLLVVLIGLIIDFGLIGNGRGAVRR